MGIRIDPSLEFLWRDPTTVQLGADPPRAVVPVTSTGEERLLCALRHETGRDVLPGVAAAVGCPPADAARVLGAAAPAMREVLPDRRVPVEVHGSDPLTDEVARLLAGDGVTVVRTQAPRGGPVTLPATDPVLAVLVAQHVVDPEVRAAWTRRPVPHLPVVVGDGRVRIGPFVVPDTGPCLQCLDLARADEDAAWPAIAAQVWGRPVAPMSPWRTATVAATVARLVLDRVPLVDQPPDREQLLVDRDDLAVTSRRVAPHPRCACRGLPGTDWAAGVRPAPSPAPTT